MTSFKELSLDPREPEQLVINIRGNRFSVTEIRVGKEALVIKARKLVEVST